MQKSVCVCLLCVYKMCRYMCMCLCVSVCLSQQFQHSCTETFVFQIYANQPNLVLTVSDHMPCVWTITRPKNTTKICLFFRMSDKGYWKAIDILAKWGHAKHNCCWAPNSGKQLLRQRMFGNKLGKRNAKKKNFSEVLSFHGITSVGTLTTQSADGNWPPLIP